MHLSTIHSYSGSYAVLGRVMGNYIQFLGQGGLTIGEISEKAEAQVIDAAEKLGAWGVIGLTYSLSTHSDGGTFWAAVLVAGTAISEPEFSLVNPSVR